MPTAAQIAQQAVDDFVSAMAPSLSDDGVFKVVSFNMLRGRSAAAAIEDLQKMMDSTDADVIGCQEAWEYNAAIHNAFGAEWAIIDGSTTRDHAVPLLIRKSRYQVLDSGTFEGSADGAAADVPQRMCNWARIQNGDGQQVHVINTHCNSFVTNDPGARGQRAQLYRDHLYRLREEVLTIPDDVLVFITADWNVSYKLFARKVDYWPMRCLGSISMVSNWSYDRANNPNSSIKAGASLFDQVYHRKDDRVSFVGDRLLSAQRSDHLTLLCSYLIARA